MLAPEFNVNVPPPFITEVPTSKVDPLFTEKFTVFEIVPPVFE